MINLFSFASSDQSLVYLYEIFGSMSGIIAPSGQVPTSYGILGAMFKVFNSTILAVGALAILYITVMSVVMTAHEGEFMGKKWNNIWIFIRIVFAIALMVPSTAGYCAIQFIMMWIIVQGIGAADVLWTSALNYVNAFGSVYTQPTVPVTGAANNFQGLFQSMVCDATARFGQHDPTQTQNGDYFCAANNNSWCQTSVPQAVPTATTISFGPGGGVGTSGGACGSLTYCDASSNGSCSDATSLACATCQAQITAINATIQAFSQIAQQFVQQDYEYRSFWQNSGSNPSSSSQWQGVAAYCAAQSIGSNQCCVSPMITIPGAPSKCQPNNNFTTYNPNDSGYGQNLGTSTVTSIVWPYGMSNLSNPQNGNPDFISVIVNSVYQPTIQKAITDFNPNNSQSLSGVLQTAQQQGWIMAGSFYYNIASVNDTNAQGAVPPLSSTPPSPPISTQSNAMGKYRNNYNAAAALFPSSGGSSPQAAQTTATITSGLNDTGTAFQANANPSSQSSSGGSGSSSSSATTMTMGANPLARLQGWGRTMLLTAQLTFVAAVAIAFVAGLLGNSFEIFALGNGAMNPFGPAWFVVLMFTVPIILGFLGILVTYGGLLAVYAPLIPYIIWVTAVIGWFIAVIEAMVAGPLVALGMLSPNAQGHEIMGKSEAALAHIFSIFLRPSLMVFGLVAALLLSSAVVAMIDAGFSNVQNSVGFVGKAYDPLGAILFYGAYIALIVGSLNKTFATIHIIPSQVLTWMGLHHPGVGGGFSEELVSGAKQGIEQAGSHATSGMKGGVSMARAFPTAMKERKEDEDDKGPPPTVKGSN